MRKTRIPLRNYDDIRHAIEWSKVEIVKMKRKDRIEFYERGMVSRAKELKKVIVLTKKHLNYKVRLLQTLSYQKHHNFGHK